MSKIRVGILFGGQSTEHEISILSAKNVVSALSPEKYEITLIGIDKNGQWHVTPSLVSPGSLNEITPVAGSSKGELMSVRRQKKFALDVIFPVLHGINGEDGSVQGLLKLSGIPFVGAGILGSAVGMDKDVSKRLLRDGGINVAKFLILRAGNPVNFTKITRSIGNPFFIKPANSGSSVGVSKVHSPKELDSAVKDAGSYDSKIIAEEYIQGREIECSVLGNENPIASVPGEVITTHDFYSYDAKYRDENGTKLVIPANLKPEIKNRLEKTAVEAFKILCCDGMARVDFFLTKQGKIYVNEINTVPGFTNISMYPKLWEASGISQGELIDRLIKLALDKFKKERLLKSSFSGSLQS